MKWMVLLIFGGLGLAVLVGGVIWGTKRYDLFRSGRTAAGIVVDVYKTATQVSENLDGADQRTSAAYFPVVEFSTPEGKKVRFQGSTGRSTPEYEIGAKVEVVYNPQNPQEAQLGDFSQMWLGPTTLAISGLLLLLLGIGSFFMIGSSDREMATGTSTMQREMLLLRPDSIKVKGTIKEVRAKAGRQYVFVCGGVRPGKTSAEEFETDFFTFDPGPEYSGREVTIYLDPNDTGNYCVELGSVLKDVLRKHPR